MSTRFIFAAKKFTRAFLPAILVLAVFVDGVRCYHDAALEADKPRRSFSGCVSKSKKTRDEPSPLVKQQKPAQPTAGANQSATTAALKVPGRVQSRINVSNDAWQHVVGRHFSGSGSRFTISQSELRSLLTSRKVIDAPVSRVLNNKDGPAYVREIVFDSPIGLDKFNGRSPTSTMTVLTDSEGNLRSAFPGVLR